MSTEAGMDAGLVLFLAFQRRKTQICRKGKLLNNERVESVVDMCNWQPQESNLNRVIP